MPRYFFHVHDGAMYRDEEGIELQDLAAARAIALKLSSDLLRDAFDQF